MSIRSLPRWDLTVLYPLPANKQISLISRRNTGVTVNILLVKLYLLPNCQDLYCFLFLWYVFFFYKGLRQIRRYYLHQSRNTGCWVKEASFYIRRKISKDKWGIQFEGLTIFYLFLNLYYVTFPMSVSLTFVAVFK